MGDQVRGCTEIQINVICSFFLILWCSHSTIEGHRVGQVLLALENVEAGKKPITRPLQTNTGVLIFFFVPVNSINCKVIQLWLDCGRNMNRSFSVGCCQEKWKHTASRDNSDESTRWTLFWPILLCSSVVKSWRELELEEHSSLPNSGVA